MNLFSSVKRNQRTSNFTLREALTLKMLVAEVVVVTETMKMMSKDKKKPEENLTKNSKPS
jgi:hypothetical protein